MFDFRMNGVPKKITRCSDNSISTASIFLYEFDIWYGILRPDSGKRVLPPISSEGDRAFVKQVEESLQAELSRLASNKTEPDDGERFTVFKNSFSQVIEHVSAYKPLLLAIKGEYESCIDTIERGQKEAMFLSGKVKAMAAEQNTITLYQKRADELEYRIATVKSDNEHLRMESQEILSTLEKRLKVDQLNEGEEVQPKKKLSIPTRDIPGLTLEESTDIDRLKKELSNLDQTLKNLHMNKDKEYRPRWRKDELKQQLASKSKAKDHVSEQNQHLKSRSLKLHVALDALRAYYRDNHEAVMSPAEFVTLALTRSASKMSLKSQETTSNFEDDDPTKEREAELLLDYIDQFNDLFEEKRFSEAAMHAANSPKGILRNPETLARFKAIHVKPAQTSPLLMYCEALIASVPAAGIIPDAEISLECVKAALNDDRLDLVTHWLATKRLTLSEPLGHLLYNYTVNKPQETILQCLPLAQMVYMKVGAHIQAAVCMCRQGKIHAMVEYAQAAKFSQAAYLGVLVASPSLALAELLMKPSLQQRGGGVAPVTFAEVVHRLLRSEHHQIGLELLEKLQAGQTDYCIKDIVFKDERTRPNTWQNIIKVCYDNGLQELALEIFAAVTVLESIQKAKAELETVSS
ncbi:Clathrin heavy chain linker domain-containing protein 1 [Holothuria leucospilota]|uniref:Clathrin heavy chain linker domain-containing protein 1 n=1 Tax=Holothuria leucospilota TaxID=206669 RepID=A0A9Q1CK58_HOLLE|nr:Clathrin heavy chain linker domain-containing protein 1 [Holothuria leucospilota]